MAFISKSCAACATDSQIVSEIESCRCWRRLWIGSSLADSASSTIFAIIATVSRGYLPLAVSAESITASEPSRIAFATSLASARVGRGFSIIDSSICVAVITGLRQSAARRITCFCMIGTFSGGISTPRSPRATITPSATSSISSRFAGSMACGFSSLAMTHASELCTRTSRFTSRISSAVRINETATMSTPCFRPKSRSFSSFSVREGTLTTAPGRLMPLCSPSSPPLITSHSTSSPRTAVTRSSSSPSESRIREPGSTSCASVLNVVESTAAVPAISRGVMVKRAPLLMAIGVRYLSLPVRILGPCRSCRMQMVRPSFSATLRRRSIMRACSSCVPWEKFSRATSMPRRIRSRSAASVPLAGPMVHTILAFRTLGPAVCSSALLPLVTRSHLLFRGAFFHQFGIHLRVQLRAQQDDDRNDVQPHQQRDGGAQRTVNHRICGIDPYIPAKQHGCRKPEHGCHDRPRKHAPPRLRFGQSVMIHKRRERNRGEHGNAPAHAVPHQQDQRFEQMHGFVLHPVLNFIAEGHQDGRKAQRNQSQQDQVKGDQALMPKPPGVGHVVGPAESVHPGDHYPCGRQQRDDGSRIDDARSVVLLALEKRKRHRTRPRRQHPTHGL